MFEPGQWIVSFISETSSLRFYCNSLFAMLRACMNLPQVNSHHLSRPYPISSGLSSSPGEQGGGENIPSGVMISSNFVEKSSIPL